MSESTFRILSIDGGGIRGCYPATMLQLIEDRLDIDVRQRFDLIAGTSTGAIIAAGLAVSRSPGELLELYRDKGASIFGTRKRSLYPARVKPGFHSAYEKAPLQDILQQELGSVTLGEIEQPLIIPATDVGNGGVHVFKSGYDKEFTRDKSVPLTDAVLASCSAPTYFDPTKVNNYLLADGGVWANNPTLIAIVDAQYRLGASLDDIRVVSLGTGHSKVAYGTDESGPWGLMNGWGGKEFISFLLSLQSQSINNYSKLILRENLLRLDFESDLPLPLDDHATVSDLVARADKDFTYQSEAIRNFLSP